MELRRIESNLEVLKSYRENAEIFEWDFPKSEAPPNRVIFVDGKLRHLLRYEPSPSSKLLISQVVVGAILYCCRRVEIIDEPKSVFVAAFTSPLRNMNVRIWGREATKGIVENGDLSQFSNKLMAEMEMELSRKLVQDAMGAVIKDGSLKPIFQLRTERPFTPGYGPVGLVKNVESSLSPEVEKKLLNNLEIGDRSKAFATIYSNEGNEIRLVSSYVRIGRNTFVRLDAVAARKSDIERITKFFNSVASVVAEISLDISFGRYPNDIPPVQGLEQILGAYLYDPATVESLVKIEEGESE